MRTNALAPVLFLVSAACSPGYVDNTDKDAKSSDNARVASSSQSGTLNDSMSYQDPDASRTDNFDAPEYMQLQVVLDAKGFSPGIIDGKMGLSTKNAITAYQEQAGLMASGKLDEETRQKLGESMSISATRIVTLPREYADMTFSPIPAKSEDKANLSKLGYESMLEKLAERFHTTKEVLQTLNPDLQMAATAASKSATGKTAEPQTASKQQAAGSENSSDQNSRTLAAGTKLRVPNVSADKIASGSVEDKDWLATLVSLGVGSEQPQASKIVVDKSDGTLKAFDGAGKLLAAFTATMGSTHDPLPIGTWKIVGKAYNPPFSLDPELMWDLPDDGKKLQLPPGPNGPVGVVWIDLSKEHYGIHGTPDPETIGRAESHGCVRLTNWDAARLAQMVDASTKVVFQV